MTDKELSQLKALYKAALPGLWRFHEMRSRIGNRKIFQITAYTDGEKYIGEFHCPVCRDIPNRKTAALIVRAREAVPALIADLEASKARAAELNKMVDWLIDKLERNVFADCPENMSPNSCQDEGRCVPCWREAAEKAVKP